MKQQDDFSPMMKHYLHTKEQYQDCILLYRLGDFYEMFFEDAEKASKILDLTLTGRNCGKNYRAPMCGVPFHAVDLYIAKLLEAGQKVAICEQLCDPKDKTGNVVDRDVVRVVTPGTVMESEILVENRSNYIASVCLGDKAGVAFCEITTGEFCTTEFEGVACLRDLQEILVSYKPAEILCNKAAKDIEDNLECVRAGYVPKFTLCEEVNFDKKRAREKTQYHYNVATLDGFGLGGKSFAVSACGALLNYLAETQKRNLPHLKNIRYLDKRRFMSIDIKTRRNLELTVSYRENKRTGSLLWLLDRTETAMGARMLADWVDRPLQKPQQINARLDGVEELYGNFLLRAEMSKALRNVNDIERLSAKIAYNNLTPKDCINLKRSLQALPNVKRLVANTQSKILKDVYNGIDCLENIADLLERSISEEEDSTNLLKENIYIKKGFNAELDELYDLSENGSAKISQLEEVERNRTGIRTLKLRYNRVFGYYFEISNSFKDAVPEHFIRKQTLTNGERFVSPELKELEEKMLTASERKAYLQRHLFEEIRTSMLPYIPAMQQSAQAVAALDCLNSLAQVAESNGYCKPKINTKDAQLLITEGRHPIVERYVKRDNFIANDARLDTDENRTMVITGPNMAGKSTFMRQVALITLMAHIGSFVPAKNALIPIVDKIFTRVGASDDLSFNQSTFMVEMVEVANILNNATENSLIILDEVGRGTSTFDGLSIAWAVMEYVSQNIRAKTLFATHYHELTDLEGKVSGVKNFRVTVKEYNGTVIFLHKIARGGANKSFGIEVAKIAGVPQEVCVRAKEIVSMLENSNISYNLQSIQDSVEARKSDKAMNDVAAILRDLDMNKTSPIEAFDILNNLVKRIKDNG